MSSFATAIVSRLASLSPIHNDMTDTDSVISSQDTCSSSVASSSTSSGSSSNNSFDMRSCLSESALSSSVSEHILRGHVRHNEHLAVLLPKSLWKPDSQAARCDIFLCSKRFSIFERRHHCRKCGGVFCADCSTRVTDLLDTSNLEFLNPPRNISVSTFASPKSPVELSRVCDDCYDQIHGTKVSRSHKPLLDRVDVSSAISSTSSSTNNNNGWDSDFSASSSSSLSASPRSPHTPLDGCSIPSTPALTRSPLRRAHTSPRIPTIPIGAHQQHHHTQHHSLSDSIASTSSSGELDAYPLRHASAICKATGGGRWEPKPVTNWVGHRIPGTKAQYELDLEREEEEARIRKMNPVLRDGDFQLRVPREFEPRSLGGPFTLSTF